MKRVSVRFADKEHQDLAVLAQNEGRSINDLVREAVRLHIQNQTNQTYERNH